MSFGHDMRLPKDRTTRRIVPGPGMYSIKEEEKKGNVFSHDTRQIFKVKEGPGPGAYKIPVQVADVPNYLIPGQNTEFKFV